MHHPPCTYGTVLCLACRIKRHHKQFITATQRQISKIQSCAQLPEGSRCDIREGKGVLPKYSATQPANSYTLLLFALGKEGIVGPLSEMSK